MSSRDKTWIIHFISPSLRKFASDSIAVSSLFGIQLVAETSNYHSS
jgi:hypothetical protein